MLTSTCGYIDATLTIPQLEGIAMVQVSWIFFSIDVDHLAPNSTISTLHECCVMDFPTPCLMLLVWTRLCEVSCNYFLQLLFIPDVLKISLKELKEYHCFSWIRHSDDEL